MKIKALTINQSLDPRSYRPPPLQPPVSPILLILAMRSKQERVQIFGGHTRPRLFRSAASLDSPTR